jgi:hypothetical protein
MPQDNEQAETANQQSHEDDRKKPGQGGPSDKKEDEVHAYGDEPTDGSGGGGDTVGP